MKTTVDTQKNIIWDLDLAHSKIEFSVNHMVIAYITGYFKKFQGRAISEGEDFENAKVEISIEASSIDTNNEQRDKHLRSPEFLDAANHPLITFKSTSIKKAGANSYLLKGDFSLRGVTKNIELRVNHNGTIKDPYGNSRAGFNIKGAVNRKEYGVNWHAVLDNGGLVAGDMVEINANVEIVHK
jgi:polyisoprenoid-binding protein YceI